MQVNQVNFTGNEPTVSTGKKVAIGTGIAAAAGLAAVGIAAYKGDVFAAVKNADKGTKLKTFFSKETFNKDMFGKIAEGFRKIGADIKNIFAKKKDTAQEVAQEAVETPAATAAAEPAAATVAEAAAQ